MKALLVFLVGFLSLFSLSAQSKGGCGTVTPSNYTHNLSAQEREGNGVISGSRTGIRWVPVWYHMIAKDDGTGLSSLKNVFITHCDMNYYYNPFDIGFFIAGIDTIRSTALWTYQTMDNYDAFPLYNQPNVCNVYVNGNLPGLCGVSTFPSYSPSGGGIFVNKDCIGAATKTLQHEMGHYFNLLHTFETAFGAEKVTRGNGANCSRAGDGFCDTPADPSTNRSSCPYTGTQTDVNGDYYTPDVTLFMSYFDDNCVNTFSPQEESEMNSTLSSQRSYLLNQAMPDISALDAPVFRTPLNGDSTINSSYVIFKWQTVPRAQYYTFTLQSGSSSIVIVDTLITDTTFAVNNLVIGKTYKYKVKPISYGNTCGDNAVYQNIKMSSVRATMQVSPPNCQGESDGSVTAIVTSGSSPYSFMWSNGTTGAVITNVPSGIYSVTITDHIGNIATADVQVSDPAPVTVNIIEVGNNLTALASGGTAPYTYVWSNSVTGPGNNNIGYGNYSVTITDAKGCSTTESFIYSGLGIDLQTKVSIKIFPNPAINATSINLQLVLNERTDAELSLINVNGEIVQQLNKEFDSGINNTTLNVEQLSSGIYFVQFKSKDLIKTERISIIK